MELTMNSNKNYRLDFVITRAYDLSGKLHDLPIQEFMVIPGKVLFTKEDAEIARIDLSSKAKNGYYRVVKVKH
jgi:hypothetical protein